MVGFARPFGHTVIASGWCFLEVIILISGSLNAVTLTGLNSFSRIGGLLFIIGWSLFAWTAVRATT